MARGRLYYLTLWEGWYSGSLHNTAIVTNSSLQNVLEKKRKEKVDT